MCAFRKYYLTLGLSLVAFVVAPARAQQPAITGIPNTPGNANATAQERIIQEAWDVAYLNGKRGGYVHLVVKEVPHPSGRTIIQASRDMKLTVRRHGDSATVQVIAGTEELPDGRVLGTFMTQMLGKQIGQQVRGVVEPDGKQLHLTSQGNPPLDKRIPWGPGVLGTYGELQLLKNRKPALQKGDKFDYRIFEPLINVVVTIRGVVEDFEEISIGGGRPRLMRVSSVPDIIADMQMPGNIMWFDANYEVRRSATRMPGMGNLVMERADQQTAMAPIPPHQLPVINDSQSIYLNTQRIPQVHAAKQMVYRMTLPKDRNPAQTFARDARQDIRDVKDKSFELVVTAIRTPPEKAPVGDKGPGAEFLLSNYFITSDDPRVKQHAAAAVGQEADPWRRALMIERWVNQNMNVLNFSEAMAPASHVAQTLEGDCTEYAMLAAAMCRAVGVPSRTAIGLVYVDGPRPFLGFHMWTEVYVRGVWLATDATLGQGGVGPAHVKICDHSWQGMRAMTPLLPIMRVMLGEPTADVVGVKR
jgi:hypothetical protein